MHSMPTSFVKIYKQVCCIKYTPPGFQKPAPAGNQVSAGQLKKHVFYVQNVVQPNICPFQ